MSRHDVRGELGRGGMSVVHRAFDPVLTRDTALKQLDPKGGDADEARRRFLDEARITGNLEHPHIVPVYEYSSEPDGRDFMTMKLIAGRTLSDVVKDCGDQRLEPDRIASHLEVLLKVCDALAYAHHRGVIHRDVKPTNIMVGDFGEVYLVDWGIARRSDEPAPERPPDTTVGTPAYMAPEQIESADTVDPRADVYALGGVLYFVLTGLAPHAGKTNMARMTAALYGRIQWPEELFPATPPALARVVRKALATDREDRYPDVRSFRKDVEGFLRGAWALPTRVVKAGEIIVAEGDPGHDAFVIRSGRCRVQTKAAGVVRDLGPGDVFGELAILADRPRTATIVAATDVELLVVDRGVLAEGLGLNSWMGRFVRALATRFADLEADLRGS